MARGVLVGLCFSVAIFGNFAFANSITSNSPIGSTPNKQGLYQVANIEFGYNQFSYTSPSPAGTLPNKQGKFTFKPGKTCGNQCQHQYISPSPVGSLPDITGKHRTYR